MRPFTLQDALRDVHGLLDTLVEQDPEITGRALLDRLAGMIAVGDNATERGTCRCGKPIVLPPGFDDWVHDTSARERGCRAATYEEGQGWDDSVSTSWKARPMKSA